MPDKQQSKKLTQALNHFYANPIAKVSLELFLTVGAILFFAMFAIRPTLVTMSDLVKEIEDKKELDEQLTQKVAALSTAQNLYLSIEDRVSVLDEAIPTNPEFIETMKIVEKIASDNNLVIESISIKEFPPESSETKAFEKLDRLAFPVSLTLQGDYLSIRQFAEDLLNSRRTMIVDTVIFSTSEERGKKRLRANITLSVPYFGEE